VTVIDLAGTVEERRHLVHLHGGNQNGNRRFHKRNILTLVMLYDAIAYVNLAAEVLVVRGFPAEDGSN